MYPQLPLFGLYAHTHVLRRRWCDKPDKNLEKNSDPPIINPIIREKKVLILAANFQSQIGPQSTLVGVHAHTCVLGRRWCDKPDKNLEKNWNPPIINPIIREKKSSLIFAAKSDLKCNHNHL